MGAFKKVVLVFVKDFLPPFVKTLTPSVLCWLPYPQYSPCLALGSPRKQEVVTVETVLVLVEMPSN